MIFRIFLRRLFFKHIEKLEAGPGKASTTIPGLFFNPRGRITRQAFILSYLAWGFVLSLFLVIFYPKLGKLSSDSISAVWSILFGFGALIMMFYPYFIIHIKRLHDLGYSGRWSILLIILPRLEKVFDSFIPSELAGGRSVPVLLLLFAIYLAVRKGSLKANRYGESPLANKKSFSASLKAPEK